MSAHMGEAPLKRDKAMRAVLNESSVREMREEAPQGYAIWKEGEGEAGTEGLITIDASR
ncbi:MAG: hypothetical protein IPI81_17895 [Flavobacteriales bacterium]|nr:hypothetical protein [Flavobacteriales bacterium]